MKVSDNKAFKKRQDKKVDTFPTLNGVGLQQAVEEKYQDSSRYRSFFFSLLEKDPKIGICEVVYGLKYVPKLKKNVLQKHFVIPENQKYTALVRNAYYNWGGMASGLWGYGYDKKGKRCNYYSYYDYSPDYDFIRPDFPLEKIFPAQGLICAQDIALLDPELKYNNYRPNGYITVMSYIRLYRQYPQSCEMLMKMGLFSLVTPCALGRMQKDPAFARWIARNREKLEGVGAQTAYCSYKSNPNQDPQLYRDKIRCKTQMGRLIAMTDKGLYKKVLECTTRETLCTYLAKNRISPACYEDYLVACNWLRRDFSDTKVLFPREFWKYHDDYTNQYNQHIQEEQRKKDAAESILVSSRMAKTARDFSFLGKQGQAYCVIVATNKVQLIDEGYALKHCVGSMGYAEKQANRESIIVFIRRAEDMNTPYVTAEIKICEKTLSLAQCFAKGNTQPDDNVKNFVQTWLSDINKEYRKTA